MSKKFYSFWISVFIVSILAAQNPGGVSANLKLWIKSNSGTSTTTNGSPLDTWTYANDLSKSFAGTGGERPIYTSSSINFQPGITFSGSQLMDGPTGVNAPIAAGDDDYSIFAVWQTTTAPGNPQRVWSQRSNGASNDGASLWIWNNSGTPNYGDQPEIAPYTQAALMPYTSGNWYVSQLNLLNQATNDLEIIDQTNLSTSPLVLNTDPGNNGNGVRTLSDVLNRLGARNISSDEPFIGNMAEVIVYDQPINSTERSRIFSYLAIKYGITLKTDLLNSAGIVIWNSSSNSTYNNSVFGLGRDDNSGLSVSQSNSLETGSGDGTGQNAKGNIVLSNPSSLDDLDFLLIGNDNAALTETTTDIPVAATGSKRLAREWKVQHTGNAGTISLSFDFTGLTVSGTIGNVNQFRLMVDQDGDGDFTTGSIRYYSPTSFTGNVANFTGITLNNNEAFAILTSVTPATLPVTWKEFNVKLVNNDVHLNWSVENNADAASYEIEHSTDGINFERIGTVSNNANVRSYSFIHKGVLSGRHYYRLHQFDIDGRATYSTIVNAIVKGSDVVTYLYNNPVRNNYAEIVINTVKPDYAVIELWSFAGSKISSQKQDIGIGTNKIRVPMAKVMPGNYILKVTVNNKMQSLQLVKL